MFGRATIRLGICISPHSSLILIATVSSEQLPMFGKCVELEAVPFNKKWYKQTKHKWLQWCRQQRTTLLSYL